MKRFWLVLLSLGLVLAFSASAMAVDVNFSGSFYAAGMYLDKTSLVKDNNISTAFYYQRLRVQTDFIVSPGLKLVTRFDAMERIWGGIRSTPGISLAADSAGTRAENENIAFDWAYLEYASPIGLFQVGEMEDGRTGTVFGNSYTTAGRIKYAYTIGPVTIKADITKSIDQSYSAVALNNVTDADNDKYGLEGVYAWKAGKAGMKVTYYKSDSTRPPVAIPPTTGTNYAATYFLFTPYAIAKIGPVDIQAELNYATGNAKDYDNGTADQTLSNLSAFVDATATFAPVYFGGTFAYISGDDTSTPNKSEGGALNGGRDWNPCLIMFNYYDRTYWIGALNGQNSTTTTNSGPMTNAWFVQGRVGVNPLAALDIMASVSWAQADQKNTNLSSDYGWEVDVTGTYKITNNLSYMLGVGYWLVGDYYKGASTTAAVNNDYMLINKLTLTF